MPIDSVMKHYKEKFSLIRKIIAKENPTIVEVGAHYGEDSMRFLETFPKAKIYCFEPDPRNVRAFRAYIDNPQIQLFEVALAAQNGTASFFQSYQNPATREVPSKYDWIDVELYEKEQLSNSGSSSLKKGYKFNLEGSITVRTQRFDDWKDENKVGEVDFAWIDVQGAEKDVLDGMGDTIRQIKLIWIEYGETDYEDAMSRDEVVAYFNERHFAVVEKFSTKGLKGDLLFLRKDVS